MTDPPQLVLVKRRPDRSIVYSAFRSPGTPLPSAIRVGAQVHLRDGRVTIVVRVVELAERAISGTVIGFEDWNAASFKGLTSGSPIDFREEHVFACIL